MDLLKTGSAYYAPSASQARCGRSPTMSTDSPGVTAYLDGPFDLHDIYIGVPAVIGRSGVERVVEVDLNLSEQTAFQQSVNAIRADLALLAQFPHS